MPEKKSYYFIVNPASDTGRLKKKWPEIIDYIKKNYDVKLDWAFTEAIATAHIPLLKAIEAGYTHIIAVGGDGIANELANAIMNNNLPSKVILGILGAGTSNDVAHGYNISFDYKESLKVIFGDNVIKVPMGKVTGDFNPGAQYFLHHTDTGLAALTARSAFHGAKWLKGEIKYYIYAIKNIVKFKENTGYVKLDGEYVLNSQGENFDHFSLIGCSLADHMGGFNMFPENNMQKEGFAILVAGYKSRLALIKLLFQAGKGNHIGKPNIIYTRANTIEIELESPWPYQSEGEVFTEDSKAIKVEYIKDAINIIVPKGFTVF